MHVNMNSPCVGVCKIDEPSQVCVGCLRTIDEITRWSRMDIDEKIDIITDCLTRQQIPNSDGSSERSDNMADGTPGNASDG